MSKKRLDPEALKKHRSSKYQRYVATLQDGTIIQASTNEELREKVAKAKNRSLGKKDLKKLTKEELLELLGEEEEDE